MYFLVKKEVFAAVHKPRLLALLLSMVFHPLSHFNLIRYACTATRIGIWPDEGVIKKRKKKEMRNQMDWLRVWNLFVCRHVYLGSREGIPITFLRAYTFSPHKTLQPWPDLGPYLRLSLEVPWVVVKLLIVRERRREVSREAEVLR